MANLGEGGWIGVVACWFGGAARQGRMVGQTDGWVGRGLALLPQTAQGKCPHSPTSGHIPRAGGGCPGRSPSHTQERGLAASAASAPWPVLGPRFRSIHFYGMRARGSLRQRGRGAGAAVTRSRARAPTCPGTKPCCSRQEKLASRDTKAALCPALCLKSAMTLPRVAKKRRAAGPVPLGTGAPHGYPCSVTRSGVGREGARGMLWISLRFLGWGPSSGRGLRRGGRDVLSLSRGNPSP